MREVDSDTLAALQAGVLVARDFIWIGGKNWDTGDVEFRGFWNDLGVVTAPVIDGETGESVNRDFIGCGALLGIDDIPLSNGVVIRTVSAKLSQINDAVALAVRGCDLKGGKAQIYRGLFYPTTRNLVAAARPRFVGFVDKAIVNDPTLNSEGSVELTLASHTRELTRASAAKRSNSDQKLRASGDTFFQYADVMPSVEQFWGQSKGKVPTAAFGGGITRGAGRPVNR